MWDFSISLWPRRVAALTIPMSGQKDLQSESIVYESPTTSPRTLDDYASTKPSPQDTIRLLTKPWPSRPQVLQKGMGGWRWWDSTVDFVMLLVPLPFFILAASVFAVNGNEVDDYELSVLEQAIKGATTIFPIFFAATAGRAAVKYATWKLEQGTTIGLLEQLMGSRTVASTFTTQVQLRTFNFIGLGLIFLWSLSPIGSQSVLHILFTPLKPVATQVNVSYFNSRQQSYSAPSGPFKTIWYNGFTILLGSAILTPSSVKEGSMDAWGNPKIPYFSRLSSATADENGWVQISSTDNATVYSSLFGIPLSGIGFGNTTMTVESSYISLDCNNLTISKQLGSDGQFLKSDQISTTGPFVSFEDVSVNAAWAIGYQGVDVGAYNPSYTGNSSFLYPQSCPDCLSPNFFNMTFEPGTLLFQEYEGVENTTSIYCTPSQAYIESSIFCMKDSASQMCQVIAQRPSVLPHMPSTITYLSFPKAMLGVTSLLPNATSSLSTVNYIQNYLYTPNDDAAIMANSESVTAVRFEPGIASVSLDDFGDRFGQLLNAYLYASMWNATPYITGAPFGGIIASQTGGNNASFLPAYTDEDITAMIQNQTSAFTVPAVLINEKKVYLAFYPWLITFLFCTTVMQVAAIFGVIYSRRTIVPDYLGYVSSLAKESPYIRMPDVGVNMDGMDKAKMVKEVKVRLGDVADEKGRVGRLAFARLNETVKVEKGKLYV